MIIHIEKKLANIYFLARWPAQGHHYGMIKNLFFSRSGLIVIAMLLGALAGHLFGASVAPLGEIGKVAVTLIKAIAAPLLFIVIIHAFISTEIDKRSGAKLVFICMFNGLLALITGISLSHFFKPGEHFRFVKAQAMPSSLLQYSDKKLSVIESIKSYFPESILKPFVDNNIISLVIIAIFFGLALRSIQKHGGTDSQLINKILDWATLFQKMFEQSLHWLVNIIPFAVFGVVAKTVGEYGFEPLKGLLIYLGVGILGLSLHILFVYHGWLLYKGISIKHFWKTVWPTLVYSFGVNSSLATLPLTLKNLHELKVSKKSSTLGACVGTNLNNDGILLYEAMAVFFVAQASGIDLSLPQQLMLAGVCVIGTIGVAGIPEAGFITLAIVLSTVGLPTEILPMLLTVDWILGRMRTVTNVLADMTVSIALDPKHQTS